MVKFAQEFGAYINGGQGHTLVLASEGYADILVQRDFTEGGYSVFRRGDADVVFNARTQRECKAYALEALEVDQQG